MLTKFVSPTRLFLLALGKVFGSCPSTLPVSGSISVTACDSKKETCVSSVRAVFEYAQRENDSSTYSVAVHSSPWRLYDPNGRILRLEDLAAMIKPGLKPYHKHVLLLASWSGVAPGVRDSSIAARLSARLGGFAVVGQDGFLWFTKDGKTRTTRQAFTAYTGNYATIRKGDDVFVSMTTSWAAKKEDEFIKDGNHEGIQKAGLAWDVFGLCPEYALDRFEAASTNSVALWNAAAMRLEMKTASDSAKAIEHLRKASQMGDAKSKDWLSQLSRK